MKEILYIFAFGVLSVGCALNTYVTYTNNQLITAIGFACVTLVCVVMFLATAISFVKGGANDEKDSSRR